MAIYIIGVFLSFFILIALGTYMYIRKMLNKKPGIRPERYNSKSGIKKVVCIGDSITQGTKSFDYVSHLSGMQSFKLYDFINAGSNKDLTWNVLQRLDSIIAIQPDYITILIGSYEIEAILSNKNSRKFMKTNKLPKKPSKEWFRENLEQIIQRIQNETTARIALMSPPLMGDNLDEESNELTKEYSNIIKSIARLYGITYLALNERERELLQSLGYQSRISYKTGKKLYRKSAFKRYILHRSWDEISASNGFLLTPDLFHLNSKGGKIIVHLIEKFITKEGEQRKKAPAQTIQEAF